MRNIPYAQKIAIIGPYPPPYGGISVHIERILQYIPSENVDFYNIGRRSGYKGKKFYGWKKYGYLALFLLRPYKVIHYHSTSPKIRILLALLGMFESTIYLHAHGESLPDTIRGNGITARLTRALLPYVHILASNSKLVKFLSRYHPRSIQEMDAFLPPLADEKIVNSWFQKINPPDCTHKISMVGWFSLYQGHDLYGYDQMLEALSILRKRQIDLLVLASVNGINDNTLYDNFLRRRAELALDNYFILLHEECKEIYPLYLYSEIFVRPTISDGSAMSVKEALWFGCSVVTSDVVPRPAGVSLYENRNSTDLADKILSLIEKNDFIPLSQKLKIAKDKRFYHPLIKEIYGLE